MQKEVNWTKYNKVLRNLFTVLLIIIVYSAIIVYLGIFKEISFTGDLILDVGAFTIISFVGVRSIRWDVTQRAFIDENSSNNELVDVNYNIKEQVDKIENDDLGNEFVDKHNEIKQQLANKKYTKEKISKLNRQLRKLKIKGKLPWVYKLLYRNDSYEDVLNQLEKKLTYYKENIQFDKSYKPIQYDHLVSISDTVFKKKMSESEQIDYNPKKDAWWTWIFAIIKFIGIAGTAIPFNLNNLDWTILIPFYIALTITALITTIRRYISVRKKTATIYLHTRKTKLKLLKNCNKYITHTEEQALIKKNEEDAHKSQILKKDDDVIFDMDGESYFIHRKDFVNPIETPALYGYGDSYKDAYQDMLENQKREDTFTKLKRDIEIHFDQTDIKYELKLNKDLFNKEFANVRLKDKYDIKYITYIKQTNEYYYEVNKKGGAENGKRNSKSKNRTNSGSKRKR